jgi:hypothetical protein
MSYRLARICAIVDLVFIFGMLATITYTGSKTTALDGSNDWVFRLFQAFGAMGLVGIFAGAWNVAEIWLDRSAGWRASRSRRL